MDLDAIYGFLALITTGLPDIKSYLSALFGQKGKSAFAVFRENYLTFLPLSSHKVRLISIIFRQKILPFGLISLKR